MSWEQVAKFKKHKKYTSYNPEQFTYAQEVKF